tara:strand:+ start:1323 stop:2228 length:906 start_codon:yes stop_codon:yes gene_type:complete
LSPKTTGLLDPQELNQFRPREIHQSDINTAEICHLRLSYSKAPDRVYTSDINRAMGTGYHAGLALYYVQRMEGNLVEKGDVIAEALAELNNEIVRSDPEIFSWNYQQETAREQRVDLDLKDAENMLSALIVAYFDQGRVWPDEYEVKMVEKSVMLPLTDDTPHEENMWVRKGTVDLVLQGPDGWHRIVDHKTAKKKWQKNKESHRNTPQPGFYIGALREILQDDKVTFTYDIASWKGDFQRIDAPRTVEQIDAVKSKALITTGLIEGNTFMPNTTSFLCSERFCDYWLQCPFGEALERTNS